MNKLVLLNVLAVSLVLGLPAHAQEMPPGQIIVVTGCLVNDGYSVDDVMTAARSLDYSVNGGPNFVFFRQPVSGNNLPQNLLMRVNYFNNLEHWTNWSGPPMSAARQMLGRMLNCNTTNRTISMNYNIGQGGQPYEGGTADTGLVTTRACRLKPGATVQEAYNTLLNFNQQFRDQGDTSLFQISHRFMGPTLNVDMGSRFLIRVTGTTPEGLAQRIDMSEKAIGTPPNFAGEDCSDPVLWTSHVVHWGGANN
jgi:hypothetical protein